MDLTRKDLLKARDFILANGDDITKAWFRYNFEGEDTAAFLEVLGKHQHENGGFGGLVHEFAYQGPCLKCTEHAFRYLYEAHWTCLMLAKLRRFGRIGP